MFYEKREDKSTSVTESHFLARGSGPGRVECPPEDTTTVGGSTQGRGVTRVRAKVSVGTGTSREAETSFVRLLGTRNLKETYIQGTQLPNGPVRNFTDLKRVGPSLCDY